MMLENTLSMGVGMKHVITLYYVVVVMSGTGFILQYGDI
jgi:hypothetical protein